MKNKIIAIFVFILVFVAFIILINLTDIGIIESQFMYDTFFSYLRGGTLFLLGILLILIFHSSSFAKVFSINTDTLSLSIVTGVALGGIFLFFPPIFEVQGKFENLSFIILATVIGEEFFFRGFITNSLTKETKNKWVMAAIAGILYGVYLLSYQFFYTQGDFFNKLIIVLVGAASIGIPTSVIFTQSRSVIPSILCHLSVKLLIFGTQYIDFFRG